MAIASQVQSLLNEFEKENPKAKGKATLGSGNRTADQQVQIILQPKRKKNYLQIKARFQKAFPAHKKTLPLYKDLKADEKKWWITEVNKQAGKANGFAHVGGNAQDVTGVDKLAAEEKTKLKEKFETKFGVLLEKVTSSGSDYDVPVASANVFHVYKK